MKSIRKLLCCSWAKKKPRKHRTQKEVEDIFIQKMATEKGRETGMRKNQSSKSMSTRDSGTTTPFVDDGSYNSFEIEDVTDDEDTISHVEAVVTDDVSVRVTTRPRYTYGLEDFAKNAMLIFSQSEGREDYVEKRIKMLKARFSNFRFDAEVHVDPTKDEMEAKLEEFFSRDFSLVGAVAVVVLAKEGEAAVLEARAQRYHESMLLRWLTEDQPSSLRGKPKIYITEANRTGVTAETGVYSLLVNSYYHDVVGVHIPVVVDGESHPLEILCERLGGEDFLSDVYTATHTAETMFPELKHRPIQVVSTLQMQLRLAKKTVVSTFTQL